MHQEKEYPQHVSGSHLNNPDFAALARAYGYVGVRITRTDEFEGELLAALARREGTLIEIMLDPEVITTRASLSAIRQTAIEAQGGIKATQMPEKSQKFQSSNNLDPAL